MRDELDCVEPCEAFGFQSEIKALADEMGALAEL